MANNGKKSEETVRVILKGYQEKFPAFFTRLYDSTTARGGFVPPQVADFLGVFEGIPYAIEVKSSEKHNSLRDVPKGYIRASQIVGGRIFIRAGGKGLFIFHGLRRDVWEVWDTAQVIDWVLNGVELPEDLRMVHVVGKKKLELDLSEKLKWLKSNL